LEIEDENITEEEVLSLAKIQKDIAKYLEDQQIKRVVYRTGKILNIVI
jgi:leucyl-tRNA synthetase